MVNICYGYEIAKLFSACKANHHQNRILAILYQIQVSIREIQHGIITIPQKRYEKY